MKKESKFQKDLIDDLRVLFPGAIILMNDANYLQGIPDLLILFHDKWAVLECKKYKTASHQPNQDYYVELAQDWSYGAFIYPENREQILHELQLALKPRRSTRVPKR